jgi:hypothetical protein
MNIFSNNIFSGFFTCGSEAVNHNIFQKLTNLSLSLFFGLLIITLCVVILIFPLDIFITKCLHFESIRNLIHISQEKNQAIPFYLIVFIGPFSEEILFRLALKVNKFNVAVFFGIFTYLLLGGSIAKFNINNTIFLYYVVISITISILSYFHLSVKIIDLLNQKTNYLIVFSIVLFGLVHISNIKILHWQLAMFYPFYVLPQMIMAYFITNLRLKYGFLWGLSFHILINAFSIFLK